MYHVELHPSPFNVLVSSHCHIPLFNPSPQISSQVSLVVAFPPVQVHPTSTPHELLHPSPFNWFISSQPSVPSLNPSPQTSTQVSPT